MKHRVAVNHTVHELNHTSENVGTQGSRRKGGKFAQVDALLDDTKGPLDDEGQEQLIQEFESLQLEQTRIYRAIFGLVGVMLTAFFLWAAWDQRAHPFEQRFTGELRAAVPSSHMVQGLFMVQTFALTCTSLGMLRKIPPKGHRERGCMPTSFQQRNALRMGLLGSLACCCVWLWAHFRMVQIFGWNLSPRGDLLWIPLAPLAFSTSCLWVVSSLDQSAREVSSFRGAKYDLKQV